MNFALVSLSCELAHGISVLRKAIRDLSPLEAKQASALYRRIDSGTDGTLSAELVAVVHFATMTSLFETKRHIQELKTTNPNVRVTLLTFNYDVMLEPQMPVPHPDLHLDQLILHCAAEIQGGFEHPVLGRSLQELVKSSQSRQSQIRFEFLSRGEGLLSTKETP